MTTRLKCLLLDDELPGLMYLKMLCEQIPGLEVVKAFNNPTVFLSELPNLDFDFCILDIEMPDIDGLQVANLLNGKPVIFTTAYKEYAAEAFDLDAIDYVRKPITKERLQQAIQKAIKRLGSTSATSPFMQLNTDKGKAIIFFDQLLYIKSGDSDSRDKMAYLADGRTLTLKNIAFEKLQELLPPREFCRINKKEIIAIKAVQVFSFDEIIISNFDKTDKPLSLSLSEVYRNDFIKMVEK